MKHKRRNPRVFRSVAIESNRQPSFKSNWADFAKVADVGELDLDAIAYDTGYDNFRNLDMSVSPRTIAKERGTPSGALRFRKFAKAIREHSLKLEDASADQIAKALMGEAIKRNPRFDNQGRDLEAGKRAKEAELARYRAGYKEARAMFEKTVKDVPLADWTSVDGVEVLRSGSSRYVAAPRNGKRTAASFDVIDIKAGELVVQLKKDEVYGWLWRAAQNEHEMKRNPTTAYHRARGDAQLVLAEDAYKKAKAMSRRGDAKGAHDSLIHAHRMAALAESDLTDGASTKAAKAKSLTWWKAYSQLAQSPKRNPAKGYKMPEAQARHTAEGLLARMKADGADTFAKKVKWVKKHMPSIDRPRTFVGWVTKGERGRVVYKKRNPLAGPYPEKVDWDDADSFEAHIVLDDGQVVAAGKLKHSTVDSALAAVNGLLKFGGQISPYRVKMIEVLAYRGNDYLGSQRWVQEDKKANPSLPALDAGKEIPNLTALYRKDKSWLRTVTKDRVRHMRNGLGGTLDYATKYAAAFALTSHQPAYVYQTSRGARAPSWLATTDAATALAKVSGEHVRVSDEVRIVYPDLTVKDHRIISRNPRHRFAR